MYWFHIVPNSLLCLFICPVLHSYMDPNCLCKDNLRTGNTQPQVSFAYVEGYRISHCPVLRFPLASALSFDICPLISALHLITHFKTWISAWATGLQSGIWSPALCMATVGKRHSCFLPLWVSQADCVLPTVPTSRRWLKIVLETSLLLTASVSKLSDLLLTSRRYQITRCHSMIRL